MARWWALPLALLLVGCGPAQDQTSPDNPATGTDAKLETLSHREPNTLVDDARRLLFKATAEFVATPTEGEPYTGTTREGVRRMERPAPRTGEQTVQLEVGDEFCFNRALIPEIRSLVSPDNATLKFDDTPWFCADRGVGLPAMMSNYLSRLDLLGRIPDAAGLDVSDPEVTDVAGEPALRVEFDGYSGDGPLGGLAQPYELWINSDGLPIKATTADVSWTYAYPDTIDESLLTMPSKEQRGRYTTLSMPANTARRAMSCGGDPKACPELAELQRQLDELNAD